MCVGLNTHACGGRLGSTHVEDSGQPWVSDFTFQITWDGAPAGFLLRTADYLPCFILRIPVSASSQLPVAAPRLSFCVNPGVSNSDP